MATILELVRHVDIKIEDNLPELLARFADQQKKLEQASEKIRKTFVDWQIEDVNSKYPQADMTSNFTVTGSFYPRSRVTKQGVLRAGKPKTRRQRLMIQTLRRRTITKARKPVMRQELITKLHERMRDLLREIIAWQ